MGIEDYKLKIHKMVDEITDFNYVIQIYTAAKVLYRLFKRNE